MEGIARCVCLLLLINWTAGRFRSANEATLDFIYKNLDDSADPCQDFQEFSSGKFKSLHTQPKLDDLSGSIHHAARAKLQVVLEQLKDRVFIEESSAEGKVWRLYNTCLTAPNKTWALTSALKLMPPGEDLPWPAMISPGSEWPEQRFEWLEALARLRQFGIVDLIIRMNVVPNWYDLSHFVIYLQRPTSPMIPNESLRARTLTSLGIQKSKIDKLNADITALNAELENLPKAETRSFTLSIEDFEGQTGIQLSQYLEISFGRSFDSRFEVKINGMGYLEGLKEVMEKYDKEVVASHMMMGALLELYTLHPARYGKTGVSVSEMCTDAVRHHMSLASELLYKDHYFRQGRQQDYELEVHKLFEVLRAAFLERIERNRLKLNDVEKSFVKQKLLALKVRLGSLPQIPNQRRFVDDLYSDLELDAEPDMARAMVNILEHHARHTLKQLDRPVPKGNHFFLLEESVHSVQSEPHHKLSDLVVVPYDILQEPYFSPDQHDIFKVSLLGFLMIRAALQNFKPYEVHYDNETNYSYTMHKFGENSAYVKATTCLSRYNESYNLDNHVVAVVSLGLVYDLYFGEDSKFSQEQPSFTKLPLKQVFLLNFAQTLMKSGNQGVNLNHALRNLKAFGEVFNCPTSSFLNPAMKCQIW